ncbi:MAG: hypothetical protein ABI670_10475 [Chloroflexota bacterium]
MSYSEEPISVVEDLDPEPQDKRGGARPLLELVLGLLLLFGVIGFAGWQWIKQETQQSSYAQATDALIRQDWDSAYALFVQASGYRDADRQAENVQTRIDDRNRQYKLAVDYKQQGKWLASLVAIQKMSGIQTVYKDSAEIDREARDHVYSDAISGTVAMRQNANPTGLYYYGTQGWLWLPQSDAFSKIRGNGLGDWLVYDVPGDNWLKQPTPTPQAGSVGPDELVGRRLMAARMPDFTERKLLPFDPGIYGGYLWGQDGVWLFSFTSSNYFSAPVRYSYFTLSNGSLTYQSFSSPLAFTVTHDTSPDYAAIMDVDPNSDRYLLARWEGATGDGTATRDTNTSLYLAHAGSEPKLIYTLKGGSFVSAQLSEDGRYALLNTYVPLDQRTERQNVLLLDLQGNTPPRNLAQVLAQVEHGPMYNPIESSWLQATFLTDGPYAGKVLLAEYDVDHSQIRVLDIQSAGEPLVETVVQTGIKLRWTVFPGRDDLTLIAASEMTKQISPPAQSIRVITLAAGKPPTLTELSIDRQSYLEFAAIVDDYLVYTSSGYGPAPYTSRTVSTFPLAGLGSTDERPSVLYKNDLLADSYKDPSESDSYAFGSGLFAYIRDDDLHVRAYDGSADIVLKHNISYLYTARGLSWQVKQLR